ncbi:succinate dehydrogenase, hydrophobic membrane anchor protein [Salinisphaera sp. USBA-960]|uniref:succinate dehydrogenase, hydrophobic membrane anchor protein n=1 Tax=Salinisphaera orenii TaxID=856731 RepID=UPI000DBE4B12|nr:succinate dehydrogenase, hydrophobic membrane anchor protein [Salifodinibacter halophilus]NNC26069.1 succinate dehydrogenase, hydrophobic membrane anchor protein [Salifodinibacter halophilus]
MTNTTQSPLAGARGLGSAKTGVTHWWMQRVTAVALVPLTLWFVASLAAHLGADYASVMNWLTSPLSATLMMIYLAAIFYHAQLGLQVIVEDYVHTEFVKFALIIGLQFANTLLGVASIVSVFILLTG